jgi:hypothetical protein
VYHPVTTSRRLPSGINLPTRKPVSGKKLLEQPSPRPLEACPSLCRWCRHWSGQLRSAWLTPALGTGPHQPGLPVLSTAALPHLPLATSTSAPPLGPTSTAPSPAQLGLPAQAAGVFVTSNKNLAAACWRSPLSCFFLRLVLPDYRRSQPGISACNQLDLLPCSTFFR